MQQEMFTTYQNREIKVVLEFPELSDKKEEDIFMDMLKEIYLNKMNNAKEDKNFWV